jgi:hypothetical protein
MKESRDWGKLRDKCGATWFIDMMDDNDENEPRCAAAFVDLNVKHCFASLCANVFYDDKGNLTVNVIDRWRPLIAAAAPAAAASRAAHQPAAPPAL